MPCHAGRRLVRPGHPGMLPAAGRWVQRIRRRGLRQQAGEARPTGRRLAQHQRAAVDGRRPLLAPGALPAVAPLPHAPCFVAPRRRRAALQVVLCDQSRTECPWLAEHGLEPPAFAELPLEEPSFEELEGGAGQGGAPEAGTGAEDACLTPAGPEAAQPAAAGTGAEAAGAAADCTPDGGSAGAAGSNAVEPLTGQACAPQAAQHAGPDEQRPASGRTEAGGGSRPAISKGTAAGSRPLTGNTAAGSRPATGKGRAAGSRPAAGAPAAASSTRPATGKAAAASSRPGSGNAVKGSIQPVSGKGKAKAGSRLAARTAKQAEEPKGADIAPAPEVNPPAMDAAATEAEAAPPASTTQQAPQALCAPALPPRPPRRRRRHVHAFVLVKPGLREVMQALLLDPGTGRTYSMDEAPCTGVECAWNDRNFWASLQTDSSSCGGSGGGSGLAELGVTDWSFTNPNCWLPLLPNREASGWDVLPGSSVCRTVGLHRAEAARLAFRQAACLAWPCAKQPQLRPRSCRRRGWRLPL